MLMRKSIVLARIRFGGCKMRRTFKSGLFRKHLSTTIVSLIFSLKPTIHKKISVFFYSSTIIVSHFLNFSLQKTLFVISAATKPFAGK